MPFFYKHKGAKHFLFEKSTKPYFGPWKNAIAALEKVNIEAFSELEFLDFIKSNYKDVYDNIEWIRFHDFFWRGKKKHKIVPNSNFRFRMAIFNIRPLPFARDYLYEVREEITRKTGWYPLVQGSRANIHNPPYLRWKQKLPYIEKIDCDIGTIKGVYDASSDNSGNCILLEGDMGQILFDTGFNVDQTKIKDLKMVFLSHFHKDHSGGIWSILDNLRVPVLLSGSSLAYLWDLKGIHLDQKLRLLQNAVVIDGPFYSNLDYNNISVFPVFHSPGSYGLKYKDFSNRSVYYFGDICLKNGFLDCSNQILTQLLQDDTEEKIVLIDCAMVGKSDFCISDEDTPLTIIDELCNGVSRRNVIFVSQSPEMLIYSYIKAFKYSGEVNNVIKMVLNNELYELIKTLWCSVILRKSEQIDPFVHSVIGNSKSNFVESHRVYPISALSNIEREENVISFVTLSDILEHTNLSDRIKKGDILLAGTLALRNDIPPEIIVAKPRSILRIASEEWSFHSREEDIADFVKELSLNGIRSYLFHNYSGVLRKFIKKYKLDNDLVYINSETGLKLSRG